MKCFDCGEEKGGFAFCDRTFLCFECMSKRANKLRSDPKFVEASRKASAENCCWITKKELESLIEYQKFAVLNNPCIRCTRKTGLCTNECSDYYQYSTNRAKYRPSPELIENKSLMRYVELLVDIKCIEADIEVLVHKKVKKKSEMIQLAKQINVEDNT